MLELLACAKILIQTVGGVDEDPVETSCRAEKEEMTMFKISHAEINVWLSVCFEKKKKKKKTLQLP